SEQIERFYFLRKPLDTRRTVANRPFGQTRRWVLLSFILFYFSPGGLLRLLRGSIARRELRRFAVVGLRLLVDVLAPRRTV
ncbi:MAG: hypothetical protein P9M14_05630, partial [Candidatus Alcyoniella australis]|nr:hypothetical protein [Candidatus Alcyoniella australis]